jgi:rhamnose transport system permease protein
MSIILKKLKSWEGFLVLILICTILVNSFNSEAFLTLNNQINVFELSVEKIIIALFMVFIILNAEIDLSVASMMGLSACALGVLVESGIPMIPALGLCLMIGALGGAFNGFWIAVFKLPSLVVTLAMLIGFRGLARVLVEDRSISVFPSWFEALGQQPFLGPFPLSLIIFLGCTVFVVFVLQYTAFGRYVYVIGNNQKVALYAGINVVRVQMYLFTAIGVISALAGILFAARLGAVRGDMGVSFELDIITIVLLGGISIFGGKGSIYGVILSILIVLYLRNGMSLMNVTGHIQTGVIGALLILSVLIPNLQKMIYDYSRQRRKRLR